MLARLGFGVATTESADEAVRLLPTLRPDVVVVPAEDVLRVHLAVSEAGTDESLRRVEAFEAAAGFAHVSHRPPSDGAQAGSTYQAEPVVM